MLAVDLTAPGNLTKTLRLDLFFGGADQQDWLLCF